MSTKKEDGQSRQDIESDSNQVNLGLRVAALIAVVIGAAGSVGLMFQAGHHPPIILRILFLIWVFAPFAALLLANLVSKGWSVITRTALYILMIIVTLISLALYANTVLTPPESTPAFMFVVVPLGSLLLFSIVVPIAALISSRLSR